MLNGICYNFYMSKPRRWAFWRRLQYGIGFGTFWSLLATMIYFGFFYVPASCFDKVMNNGEIGVDCGGGCVRICAFTLIPPEIKWAESFRIVDGQYNAVAYIENKNKAAATPKLEYTFKLMDKGVVIAERSGTTILPPNSVYPIFEGRILTDGGRVPTDTIIEVKSADLWLPAKIGRDQFRTMNIELLSTDSRPRLNAKVENTELTEARNIEVVATIFNQEGKAVTASQTFIDKFDARTTRDIAFTWPSPIAKTVRSCDVPSDIVLVLDRSGSMAADGGNPPEPLESAKQSAKSFVKLVRPDSLLGFLSYATVPSEPMEQTLTKDLIMVENSIQTTVMGKDGTQYTNMGDAFNVALAELISERHRENARKVIVFLTDGDVTRPVNPQTGKPDFGYAAKYALDMATKAKYANVTIYTIGFGDFFSHSNGSVNRDVDLIKGMASADDNYFEAPTVSELQKVYKDIASDICEVGPARIDIIPKTETNFAPLR